MSRYRQTMLEALKQVRESKQKPYVSMSSGGQYNVLDKDGKTAYSTKDQRLAQDYFKKNYDKLKEQDEKDHEISMARGELEAIADKATQLAGALQGKSDEGNPLEAWVQSKITKAKDYINSVSDYLMYNPDMKQNEETELQEFKKMTVSIPDKNKIKSAFMSLNLKNLDVKMDGDKIKVDGTRQGRDLNKFATDLKNFYNATIKVESNEEIELEEGISVKAYKNAIDPSKKGLQINKTGGMSGTIFIKDKKELKDLMTKLTQATRLYNIKEELEEGDAYDNNRYMMKKYMGQVLARLDNGNTKDSKDHVYAPNAQIAKQLYKQGKKVYREELEEAKIISDISGVGINVIKKEVMPFNVKVGRVGPGMDSDYEVEFIGSEPNLIKYAKKHLDFDGNSFSQLKKHLAMEETEVNEKTYGWTLVSKAKDLAKKFANNMTKAVDEIEKLEKGLSKNPTVDAELRKYNESLEEKYTVVITKKDGSTMELGRYNTPAEAQRYVDMYGKGAKVKKEEVELDEIDEKISDIFKANKEGESIDDIAKRLKLSTSMVKKLIGEAKDEEEKKEEPKKEDDKENKENEIQSLKSQVAMLKQKLENEKNKAIKPEPNPETGEVPLTIGVAHAEFKKKKEEVKEENLQELEEVTQKEIDKFHTALDNLVHKTFGHSSDEKKKEKMDEKVADSIIKDLQKAYAPMKGKRISPEMANKISKHLDQKSYDLDVLRQLKKADIPFISTIARNKIYKKTGKFEQSNNPKDMDKHFKTLSIKAQTKVNELLRQGMGYWDAVAKAKRMYNEDRRLYVEGIAGLQKKADKSGMPYSILKKVYDRGMAAWKSGHRPGASQQQWAFARVNSFITKSSGTWGGADKDLAAKVKGSK